MLTTSRPALRFTSVFAGIGGFDQGLLAAGMVGESLVEWDTHCQTILRRHYPNTPLMGDVSDVRGTDVGRPDVVVGGFPCQDTSTAAPHRGGVLDGKRSSHYFDFQRLIGEHLRLVDAARPRWVVIENPVGLLASPGRGKDGVDRTGWDMAAVVRGLDDLGYGWAYRVVDGSRLGTVQRRERVLVVAHRGGDPRPAASVLGVAGAGDEADPARAVRRRPTGPAAVGRSARGHDDPDLIVWRKSTRARKKLSEGGFETWVEAEVGNTLTGYDGGNALRQTHLVRQGGRLRTLTITEWERMQGFPPGWTDGVPESARWQMLGNAIHTGTAEWLAHRMVAVDASLPMLPERAA